MIVSLSLILLWFYLLVWTIITGGFSQQQPVVNVNLILDSHVLEGTNIDMKCEFNLNKEINISAVKWYRGGREIFRYELLPRPRKQVFPYGNLQIDEELSDLKTLHVKNVPHFVSGKISCELIFEDGFKLKPIMKSANLLVDIPPKDPPNLQAGLELFNDGYYTHHKLVANCTSAPAKPATNLTIYVNGSPYTGGQRISLLRKNLRIQTFPTRNVKSNSRPDILEVSRMQLELIPSRHEFSFGRLRVKCVSTLFNLHSSSSKEYVVQLPEYITSHSRAAARLGNTSPDLNLIAQFMRSEIIILILNQLFQSCN